MKLALIGTGMMGERFGRRLLDAGHELAVFNRTRSRTDELVAAGASVAETPRAAAAGAAAALTMLRDPAAVRELVYGDDGLLAGLEAGALWIDLSTVAPDDAREFAAAARRRGVRPLDAPVSGSTPAAEQGTLVLLAGGEDEDVAAARPVLDVLGRATIHLGPNGAGCAAKLMVNAFLLSAMAAAVEAVRLARGEGVAADALLAVLRDTEIAPPWLLAKLERLGRGDLSPQFAMTLALKDLRLMEETATGAELEVPLLRAVRELYAAAVTAGRGGLDFSAVEEEERES